MSEVSPTWVDRWRLEAGVGLVINDEVFPYYVHADGPMVEPMTDWDDLHILWIPVMAKGPAPRTGRPNAEGAPEAHNADLTASERSDGPAHVHDDERPANG